MQFTVEEESDDRLAFLDIQLSGSDDGTVNTSVCCKATHTDQYLVFESHHPVAHKVAVMKTLRRSRSFVILRCGTGARREGDRNTEEE